jgi:hypothetical protein
MLTVSFHPRKQDLKIEAKVKQQFDHDYVVINLEQGLEKNMTLFTSPEQAEELANTILAALNEHKEKQNDEIF